MNNDELQSDKYYFGPSRLSTKRIYLKYDKGKLDFEINGGDEHQPIYITSVVWNSSAYLQGMRPGDQIISINGIQLLNHLNYSQVLQMLYSMREIDLIIRTLRVNCLDSTLYDWYNPIEQRPTSPPPSTYLSKDAILSYPHKTVKIIIEKGKRLGLVIRGGNEYGLGIFISGVDKGSLSDQSGISIGDQILSVNGIDFLHITHEDAVYLLRNLNQITFHLRQMNKLPKPKDYLPTKQQIHFNIDLINDENYQIKFKYFLKEYLQENLSIDQFIQFLLQILQEQNQQNRNEFLESIRKLIRPNHLDRFDILILKDDFYHLKNYQDRFLNESSRISNKSMSKSFDRKMINRPQSLFFDEDYQRQRKSCSPSNSRNNSLKKSRSLHQLNDEHLSKSSPIIHLTNEQINRIEQFLQDYSSSYRITIHKVRSTLGIAIEGGIDDRIPLPRIVYMQPDGCAYVSSGLRVGHVILGLNGYSIKGFSHRDAALFLASAFKDKNNSQMDLLVVQPIEYQQ